MLAYSGGLDTSIILRWLQENHGCEVVTFTADLGQGRGARTRAPQGGSSSARRAIFVDDLREEFARDFIFPMFRANAVYEGRVPSSEPPSRAPLIAKRLVEIAGRDGGRTPSPTGATGKGNDQVRFELGAYALRPGVRIIAPWREWDPRIPGEPPRLRRGARHSEFERQGGNQSPYSMDANLMHTSFEGNELEDPWVEPAEEMWRMTPLSGGRPPTGRPGSPSPSSGATWWRSTARR